MGDRTDAVSGNDRTDDIRRDIERTQREMSRTIHEIQHRLSPHYMIQKTKDSMREAGVNASRSFIDKVRSNPIPVAMVGIGLFLMMRDSDEGSARYDVEFVPERSGWDSSGTRYSSVAEYRDFDFEGKEHGRIAETRDRLSSAAETARDRIGNAAETTRERIGQAMSSVRETTSGAIDSAADAARRIGNQTRLRTQLARYESRDLLRESPLIVGFAALAAGAILGALIPETAKENELLGETRDQLADRAKEMARDGASRAREVATAVTEAATDAAKKEVKSQTQKTDIGQNIGLGGTPT